MHFLLESVTLVKLVRIILIKDKEQKFFVDSMLGKFAKKLRLIGFDTLYESTISDEKILEIVKNQNRILVTKDNLLYKKALKNNAKVIFLKNLDEASQFAELKTYLGYRKFVIDVNLTRCTLCNGILHTVLKEKVQQFVPKKTFEFVNNFWQCKNCNHIYWEGTHIINLQEFIMKINEKS